MYLQTVITFSIASDELALIKLRKVFNREKFFIKTPGKRLSLYKWLAKRANDFF